MNFVKEVGQLLEELSPQGLHAIFERFRGILHEGDIDKRVQYTIEGRLLCCFGLFGLFGLAKFGLYSILLYSTLLYYTLLYSTLLHFLPKSPVNIKQHNTLNFRFYFLGMTLDSLDLAVEKCLVKKKGIHRGISSQYFYRSLYAVQLHNCFKVT